MMRMGQDMTLMLDEAARERLAHMRTRIRQDLLASGLIRRLEGMTRDEAWSEGGLQSWTWSVHLKDPTATVTYTMDNDDNAAIYRDGVQLGTA